MSVPHEVVIEKVVFGGSGLTRIEGKVCFVEDVLPGEKVRVEIAGRHKGFSRARLIQVLEPSPERVQPLCRYTSACGGCQYQSMSYPEELRVKELQVREMLCRHLKIPETLIQPIQHSPRDLHYREHITLHPFKPGKPGFHPLGYIAKDNRTVFQVEECLIAHQDLQPVFHAKVHSGEEEKRISFWRSKNGSIFSSAEEQLFEVEIAGKTFWTSTKGFSQNHHEVAELVIRQIQTWVQTVQPDVFMDLYAGMGMFGFLCAPADMPLISAEGNPFSLDAFKMNAERHGRKSVEVLKGNVDEVFPAFYTQQTCSRPFVFLDPPRTGLSPSFAGFLAEQKISGLAYLSCDLAILARDLKILLEKGNYQIVEVIPFDMFPRTKHIETAVLLRNQPLS